jgi:D-xylose 1-dehydrogenase (NADP+, D-xylono-1,5-lactone-forming)
MSHGGPGLRWGVLSTADITDKVLAGGLEPVAVASRDAERARAWADKRGVEGAHGSYEALLADDGIDAVYIPLPNSMHVEWSIKALEAGKHVLCEKPLTRHAADAERAFDAAERNDRVLAEAFMWRHHPQATRLRELIDAGTVGRVRLIRAAFSFPLDDMGDVRANHELEGGALMDVGCYPVSGARFVAGSEPERVYAETVSGGPGEGVDFALAATLRFPGDVLATIDCGLTYAKRDELEVVGEQGSLFLDDPWHSLEPVIEVRREDGTERVEADAANPYGCEVADFEAAVAGERPSRFGRQDAVAQARLIEALYESAGSGAPVAP